MPNNSVQRIASRCAFRQPLTLGVGLTDMTKRKKILFTITIIVLLVVACGLSYFFGYKNGTLRGFKDGILAGRLAAMVPDMAQFSLTYQHVVANRVHRQGVAEGTPGTLEGAEADESQGDGHERRRAPRPTAQGAARGSRRRCGPRRGRQG